MTHFSWVTQNSNRSIIITGYGTKKFPCRSVYMWDNKGRRWKESEYEGYGIFGGKDFYVLLAEMNFEYKPEITDEKKRNDGTKIYFPDVNKLYEEKILKTDFIFPNLTDCKEWDWRNEKPRMCPNQGCLDDNDYLSDDEKDNYRIGYFKKDIYDLLVNGEKKL